MKPNNEKIKLFERVKRCEWEIGVMQAALKNGKCIVGGLVFTADELRPMFSDRIARIESEMINLQNKLKQIDNDD